MAAVCVGDWALQFQKLLPLSCQILFFPVCPVAFFLRSVQVHEYFPFPKESLLRNVLLFSLVSFFSFCYARVELLQASLLVLCSCSLLSMFPRLSTPRGLRAEVHFLFSTLFYSVFSVFALITISLTKSYHQRQL